MMTQIRTAIRNSRATLFQDALGGVALVVMMLVALHVPGVSYPGFCLRDHAGIVLCILSQSDA